MKTFLIIVIVVVVLFVFMFVAMKSLMSLTTRVCKCKEETLKAKAGDAPRALIVYQPSVSGAMKTAVHSIAQGLNDSGYEVVLDCPGPQISADLSPYSVVFFGSPIYGGQPVKTLTDYMRRIGDFSQTKVALFVTAGSVEPGTEFDLMKEILGDTPPVATMKLAVSQKEANSDKAYQLGVDAATSR